MAQSTPREELGGSLTSRNQWIHQPLPQGRWFRLLQLLPGSSDDPIQCKLLVFDFDESPDYEPISYSWGDPKACNEVFSNGFPLLIPTSAFQLLRRFRSRADRRMLWLDAICIDQSNNEERNHQVAFMSEIYERGTRTLVWLGEEDEHKCRLSPSACLKGTTELIRSTNEYVEQQMPTRIDQESVEGMLRRICKIYDITDRISGVERWECARHFCSRSYFSRCWVLGEVGVSTHATAFCGGFSLPWSEVVVFVLISSNLLTQHRMPLDRFSAIVTSMWTLMTKQTSWMDENIILRNTKQSYKDINAPAIDTLALQVLNTSRGFKATDPRDHVYAFLGHPSLKRFLTPDYTCSLEETNRRFAESFIRSTRSLEILCFVEHHETNINTNRPSWVPQWHQPSLYSTEVLSDWGIVTNKLVVEIDGPSLKVAAQLLMQIEVHSAQMEPEDFVSTSADILPADQKPQNIIEQLWHMCMKNCEDYLSIREDFVRTLVLGGYPREEWLMPDFLSYCKTHCSSDFYEFLLREPTFANIPTTMSMDDMDQETRVNEKTRIAGADLRFESYLRRLVQCRLFVTDRGECEVELGVFGCGPGNLKRKDYIALINGCPMPLVLREIKAGFQLIGAAYVKELMYDNNDNWGMRRWREGFPTDYIDLV